MAQRYKLSYETLLAACPKWKRTAIIEDIANKKNSGLLTEFIGNVIISAELQEVDFEYKYDIASLFNYYNFINVSKFARMVGINASLMRQYKSGNQYISENQISKIEEALHKMANEIGAIKLT